ncbi:putative cytochrome p450 97b3 protein [Botrytis fragariae]|uniref:Putative cytochrome p450 97b3 protein n=1 Tax=Botrytis fragariae TaxID=1964551 RepID=A0A8H6B3V9_9HELO|nr:putative cytochrome p450 97b3 protein [Botrytis fragariae]KAF5878704.1 putative cytochrome p450 97b3 protein [Botrytis fragariae]
MSSIPFKRLLVLPTTLSYALVSYKPDTLLSTQPSYLGTFVLLYLLQFIGFAIWRVILYPYYFSPLRHLPSPKGGSWWNGQWKRISGEPTGQPMLDWIQDVPNDGIIRYLGMLNSERVMVTNAKALSEVLAIKITISLNLPLFVSELDVSLELRKNLMPAFAFRHVKNLYSVFWDKSCEGLKAMTKEVKAKECGDIPNGVAEEEDGNDGSVTQPEKGVVIMEAMQWASRITLDIIGAAGLGKDFGAIQDPDTLLNRTYRTVFKPTRSAQILGFLQLFLPGWFVKRIPIKRNGEIEEAAETIRSVCRDLIHEKKSKLEKRELTDVDILSVALESGGFPDENLIDQLMTFLAAGHETTASSMAWAIYLLCAYPEVQSRLREEVRAKLPSPDSDASVTSQDIDYMPYLNAVCNEILRYFPPVPLTLREAAIDTTISGQRIPKGTRVMLIPWAINKDEKMWGSSARKFDPDRWMTENGESHNTGGGSSSNYAFLTFLHGPRSCIGQQFAKAEFAILLATWIGRFEFELKDKKMMDEKNLDIKGGVTAKPSKGLYVKVKIVEGW